LHNPDLTGVGRAAAGRRTLVRGGRGGLSAAPDPAGERHRPGRGSGTAPEPRRKREIRQSYPRVGAKENAVTWGDRKSA
ncbi:hypothetical protein DKP78_21330, partial [Enterococcus faecium]